MVCELLPISRRNSGNVRRCTATTTRGLRWTKKLVYVPASFSSFASPRLDKNSDAIDQDLRRARICQVVQTVDQSLNVAKSSSSVMLLSSVPLRACTKASVVGVGEMKKPHPLGAGLSADGDG
jgi:hypothetical protein